MSYDKPTEEEVRGWKDRASMPPVVMCVGDEKPCALYQRIYTEFNTDSDYRSRCYQRLADEVGEYEFYYPKFMKKEWPRLSREYARKAELARKGLTSYDIAVAMGDWPAGKVSRTSLPNGKVYYE